MQKLSPMMKQYLSLKEKYKDCILLFRLGDFYELFYDDAINISKELELTLTSKSCGLKEKAPMCGVPYHSANNYIKKLVDNGHKVAICEQVTDPSESKGLVEREVVRIITQGTAIDSLFLDEKINSYIVSVIARGKQYGISYMDLSTAEFYAYSVDNISLLRDELARIAPKEIITNIENISDYIKNTAVTLIDKNIYSNSACINELFEHFKIERIEEISFYGDELSKIAAGALLLYLGDTQKNDLLHITYLKEYFPKYSMFIDSSTRLNLELSSSLSTGSKKGSLLWIMDKTTTAMGSRLIKSWVEQPLFSIDKINKRLDVVEAFINNFVLIDFMKDALNNVYDIERILSKISYKTLNPKDCLAILRTLKEIPFIKKTLVNSNIDVLIDLANPLDPLTALKDLLESAIDEEASAIMSDGGYIKSGFNANLDEYRSANIRGKEWLMKLEEKEKQETGIKNLKIGYNRLFGYYIEITKSNLNNVPLRYIRRQTISNSERFTTPELKELETKIQSASINMLKLEQALFEEIRKAIETVVHRLQNNANILKTIDAYCSLANIAIDNNYVRPKINNDGIIDVKDGRHPIVEKTNRDSNFVSNDIYIDKSENKMLIITGPNMSGKSTYMRQCALIVAMAHMGSFVPASFANISLTDKIYTRIGAGDDLANGQSTFMLEMMQASNILRNASDDSLIILDELGRGTSTFDGLSIAWAVVEYIVNHMNAKTMFSTHYHELSHLENKLEGVKNYTLSVQEFGNDVVFLRKIVKGSSTKSYGIHVAKLAGMPKEIIKRSNSIMNKLIKSDIANTEISNTILTNTNEPVQQDLFNIDYYNIIDKLKNIDLSQITPLQALQELYNIQEDLKGI